MSTQTAVPAAPMGGDPMDISATSPSVNSYSNKNSPAPTISISAVPSEADERTGNIDRSKNSSPPDHISNNSQNNMPAPPTAAAAAIHQPKIVQTAFIHKLYNMLEDPNIQHLIAWSASADSFVMSPSPDFSKVLSQYFKHTNISSFVRQLNMYGFHKERDVFHTGSPESTLWEFKHGGGNFKRGDLVGLREIKRRASRHALVHRETNYSKPVVSQPGTPAEPLSIPPEGSDARLANVEHILYDLSARLQRSEENAQWMQDKNNVAMEAMQRMLSFNQELSRLMLALVPTDSSVHRDVITLQAEMQRQADVLRAIDEPPMPSVAGRQQYFGTLENPPVSPRQLAQDDSRRAGGGVLSAARHNLYRPPVPSGLSSSTRRPFGSIGGNGTAASSPSRHAPLAPPPGPHPLSNVEQHPSLARRHTSADIREHGWHPGLAAPPGVPGQLPPAGWPTSPNRGAPEEHRLRESLSTYSLQQAPRTNPSSRPTTPPPFSNGAMNGESTFGNWSWSSASNRTLGGLKDSSAPPTRRGSMAHILNPTDTAERSDEDEEYRGEDDRKRKRMQ